MELGAEISQKVRKTIKKQLQTLGCYIDDELPEYIMMMIANKRTPPQMVEDLVLFLNEEAEKFVAWLTVVLGRIQKAMELPDIDAIAEDVEESQDLKKKSKKVKKDRKISESQENKNDDDNETSEEVRKSKDSTGETEKGEEKKRRHEFTPHREKEEKENGRRDKERQPRMDEHQSRSGKEISPSREEEIIKRRAAREKRDKEEKERREKRRKEREEREENEKKDKERQRRYKEDEKQKETRHKCDSDKQKVNGLDDINDEETVSDVRKAAEYEAKRIEKRESRNPMEFVKRIAEDITRQIMTDPPDDKEKNDNITRETKTDVDIDFKREAVKNTDLTVCENISLQAVSQYEDKENDDKEKGEKGETDQKEEKDDNGKRDEKDEKDKTDKNGEKDEKDKKYEVEKGEMNERDERKDDDKSHTRSRRHRHRSRSTSESRRHVHKESRSANKSRSSKSKSRERSPKYHQRNSRRNERISSKNGERPSDQHSNKTKSEDTENSRRRRRRSKDNSRSSITNLASRRDGKGGSSSTTSSRDHRRRRSSNETSNKINKDVGDKEKEKEEEEEEVPSKPSVASKIQVYTDFSRKPSLPKHNQASTILLKRAVTDVVNRKLDEEIGEDDIELDYNESSDESEFSDGANGDAFTNTRVINFDKEKSELTTITVNFNKENSPNRDYDKLRISTRLDDKHVERRKGHIGKNDARHILRSRLEHVDGKLRSKLEHVDSKLYHETRETEKSCNHERNLSSMVADLEEKSGRRNTMRSWRDQKNSKESRNGQNERQRMSYRRHEHSGGGESSVDEKEMDEDAMRIEMQELSRRKQSGEGDLRDLLVGKREVQSSSDEEDALVQRLREKIKEEKHKRLFGKLNSEDKERSKRRDERDTLRDRLNFKKKRRRLSDTNNSSEWVEKVTENNNRTEQRYHSLESGSDTASSLQPASNLTKRSYNLYNSHSEKAKSARSRSQSLENMTVTSVSTSRSKDTITTSPTLLDTLPSPNDDISVMNNSFVKESEDNENISPSSTDGLHADISDKICLTTNDVNLENILISSSFSEKLHVSGESIRRKEGD